MPLSTGCQPRASHQCWGCSSAGGSASSALDQTQVIGRGAGQPLARQRRGSVEQVHSCADQRHRVEGREPVGGLEHQHGVAVQVQLREDRRDQGAELIGLIQPIGLGQVEQVAVQLGDLHGEPSVLVRLAPHMAGQQFPVGRVDIVAVPSAGDARCSPA
jgi:hypothetical protein